MARREFRKGKPMTFANARIDLTLPVVDLERAKGFYGETLGLKPLDLPAPELAPPSMSTHDTPTPP